MTQGGGNKGLNPRTYTDPFRSKRSTIPTTATQSANSPPTQPPTTTPGATNDSGSSLLDAIAAALGTATSDARYVSPSPPQSAYDACKARGGMLLDDGTCQMPTGPVPMFPALNNALPLALGAAAIGGAYFLYRRKK